MNVPHRSISKIDGQGSPLEELDTFATLSNVDLMGLEEVHEAGYSDIHPERDRPRGSNITEGVYSSNAAPVRLAQRPKAALYTPLTEHLLLYQSLAPRSFLPLLRCWPRSRAPKHRCTPCVTYSGSRRCAIAYLESWAPGRARLLRCSVRRKRETSGESGSLGFVEPCCSVESSRFVRYSCFGNSSIIRSCFILQLSCPYSFEDGGDTTMELNFIDRMIILSNHL
jgi:hypothetical protein